MATAISGPVDVVVDDRGCDHPIDTERYASLLGSALGHEGVTGPGEVALVFVDADTMADLNREHLGGSGPTDVLSFPVDGAEPLDHTGLRLVGDVVVCASVAAAQASGHAGTVEDEVALLVVHGALHLCGHDHAEAAERERMWARERELLDAFWGPLAGDPWAGS
jgi:probable rRNA maturation factor